MTKELSRSARTLVVPANGLEHRVLEWPAANAGAGAFGQPAFPRTVFLLHGYMDAAGTWELVAPALAAGGFRVLAPHLRGFGDADRAPAGSYYHFVDYVADVVGLVSALSPNRAVSLVGHSMGGTIATLVAGSFPEQVDRLANLEGLGPPDNPFDVGPTRMRGWIEDVRRVRTTGESPPLSRTEARRRLGVNHAGVAPAVLDQLFPLLVREVGDPAEPGVVWRFDVLHRTRSPTPFFAKQFIEFAKKVTGRVLFVSGGPTGYHPPDEAERLAAFPNLERAAIDDAGHMLHWTRPEALAARLLAFFSAL